MKNLFQFDVSIPTQVEQELRNNLTEFEFRQLYAIISLLTTFHIIYHPPADYLLTRYRQFGLKTGDAKIAAFCEEEHIDILVSENRHFYQELQSPLIQITDSQMFCQRFSLS